MSIEHWCNDAAKGLAGLACVIGLVLTACGGGNDNVVCGDRVCDASESASSCAADCGCGNNIANEGEDCDGPDLGGATCMDETQQGGTLRCKADCTFDVSACTLANCGNGVVEEGEVCDGADLANGTCESIGYGAGAVGCTVDCTYEVSACCHDTCPAAGMSDCIGDSLRECTTGANGCLAWQVTDCAASSGVCESTATNTATCSCVDRCSSVGDTRCEGAMIESCAEVTGGCLDWTPMLNCATDSKICAAAPSGPICVPDASAEDCANAYPLSAGENVVAWTALNAEYLSSQPSCNTTTLAGPDLVLSYTAPADGFIRFTMHKPASQRQIFVVSSAACGTTMPELACMSDFSPTTLSTELTVEMGTTYYFYVRDTTSGSAPLDNPLLVTLEEAQCSTLVPGVTSLSPANGLTIPDPTPVFTANFDYPIDATQGVITVTGNMGTNLSYNLAMGPGEVAIVNSAKTLQIDPGIVFPIGETVTVSWTGLFDATCNKPVVAPTWVVELGGPPYTIAPGPTTYADACIGGTVQTLTGSDDEGRTSPINVPAGFDFFGQPAPQVVAFTNGWMSVDTSITNAEITNDPMPDSQAPNGVMAPYWDDLDEIVICTKTVGNTLIVQWNGIRYLTTNAIQFQAILDATDDSIEFVYGPSQQANGDGATVGVEDQAGAYAVQHAFNTANSVAPNSSLKLTAN